MKSLQFLIGFLFVGMIGVCSPLQAMEDNCIVSFDKDDCSVSFGEDDCPEHITKLQTMEDDCIVSFDEENCPELISNQFMVDMMHDFCTALNDETLNNSDRKELSDKVLFYRKFFNEQLTPEQYSVRSGRIMDIFLKDAKQRLDCQEEMYVDLLKKIKKCTSKEMMITLRNKALVLIRHQNAQLRNALKTFGKEFLTQVHQGAKAKGHELAAMVSVYGPQAIPMIINLIPKIGAGLSMLGKGLNLAMQLSKKGLILYGPGAQDLLLHLVDESIDGLINAIDYLIELQTALVMITQQFVSGAIAHAPQIKTSLIAMISNVGANLGSLKQTLLTILHTVKSGVVTHGPQAVAALGNVLKGIGYNLNQLRRVTFAMIQNMKHGVVIYGPLVKASLVRQAKNSVNHVRNLVTTSRPQIQQMAQKIIKKMKDGSINGAIGLKNVATSLLQGTGKVMSSHPFELAGLALGLLCAYENIATVSDLSLSDIVKIWGSIGVVSTLGYVTKKLHQPDVQRMLFISTLFCAVTGFLAGSLYAGHYAFTNAPVVNNPEISQQQVLAYAAAVCGAVLTYVGAKKAHKTLCDIELQEADTRQIIRKLEGFADLDLVAKMFERLSLAEHDKGLSNVSKRELAKIAGAMIETVKKCSKPHDVMNHLLRSWANKLHPQTRIISPVKDIIDIPDFSLEKIIDIPDFPQDFDQPKGRHIQRILVDDDSSSEEPSVPLADHIKQHMISFVEHNRENLTTLVVALTSRAGYHYVSDTDCGLDNTMRVVLATAFFVVPIYMAHIFRSKPAMAFVMGNASMYAMVLLIAAMNGVV